MDLSNGVHGSSPLMVVDTVAESSVNTLIPTQQNDFRIYRKS